MKYVDRVQMVNGALQMDCSDLLDPGQVVKLACTIRARADVKRVAHVRQVLVVIPKYYKPGTAFKKQVDDRLISLRFVCDI